MTYFCPRCQHSDVEFICEDPFWFVRKIKRFKCNRCDQKFRVVDDGKQLNEADKGTRRYDNGVSKV